MSMMTEIRGIQLFPIFLCTISVIVTSQPVSDQVTRHFSRSRPGTVPRIPASIFSRLSDFDTVGYQGESFQQGREITDQDRKRSDLERDSGDQVRMNGDNGRKSSEHGKENSDQGGGKKEAGETKIMVTESEPVESLLVKDGSEARSDTKSSIVDDVKYFTAYPLPPASLLLTDINLTTNNPLDNLKDFITWNTEDINDNHENHENEVEDNELVFLDQLAVESEQSHHSILPDIEKTDNTSQPTTKTHMTDLEINHNSSENNFVPKVNLSSVKFNLFRNDEPKRINSFDTESTMISTTRTTTVTRRTPIVKTATESTTAKPTISLTSPSTSPSPTTSTTIELIPDPTTTETLPLTSPSVKTNDIDENISSTTPEGIISPDLTSHTVHPQYLDLGISTISHGVNDEKVSGTGFDSAPFNGSNTMGSSEDTKIDTVTATIFPEADIHIEDEDILYDEDDDREVTETQKDVLSFEEEPLSVTPLYVTNTTTFSPDTNKEKEELITNLTPPDNDRNIMVENTYLTFPETVDEDSNDLETMYYSDIYAISTIQPVHEQSFYATTEKIRKQQETNFNLLKEETVVPSESYEEVTAIPTIDTHENRGNTSEKYEDYSAVTKDDAEYLNHNNHSSSLEIGIKTEPKDNQSISEAPNKLNLKTDDSSDQSDQSPYIDQYDMKPEGAKMPMDKMKNQNPSRSQSKNLYDPTPQLDQEVKDHSHPLVTLMNIQPHSMKLLIKPSIFYPNTKVQLQYERVRHTHAPLLHHLDNPVREVVDLYKEYQEHQLFNLPVGKYIVCGDAQVQGQVFQKNCFETTINKLENNELQSGVIAVIVAALLIVFGVILYAIFHKIVTDKKRNKEKELQEKVEKFAKREKELEEAVFVGGGMIDVTYPDTDEPYEERCIM